MKSENKLAGLGLLTAISASLCCITPIFALLAGTSGLASYFSWLAPLRPYLIGITIFVLGFAWYQKLKPEKQIDCNCNTKEKTPFVQTKTFLSIVTIFAVLMLALPIFEHVFYTKKVTPTTQTNHFNTQKVEFIISGMTCVSCEEHISHELNKLKGVVKTTVSYENENAVIEFDNTQTNINEIEKAISRTNYTVTDKKEIKWK